MRFATDDKRRRKVALTETFRTTGSGGLDPCLELTDDVRLEMVVSRTNLVVIDDSVIISLVTKAANKQNIPSTAKVEAVATIAEALLSASLHRMHMEFDLAQTASRASMERSGTVHESLSRLLTCAIRARRLRTEGNALHGL